MFDNKYPYTDYHELNLDWFMGEFKNLVAEWEETKGEWNSLHDYVQNYFANLNVQTEIDNKINAMILDGTFADIVSPFVTAALPALVAGQLPDVVAAQISAVVASQISAVVADQLPAVAAAAAAQEVGTWLAAHIDPDTGYVIDNSLTVSQAAADSKTVGDTFSDVDEALQNENSFLIPNLIDLTANKVADTNEVSPTSEYYRILADSYVFDTTKTYNIAVTVSASGNYKIQSGSSASAGSMVDTIYDGYLVEGINYILNYTPTGAYPYLRSDVNLAWDAKLYIAISESVTTSLSKTMQVMSLSTTDFTNIYSNTIGNLPTQRIANITPSHNAIDNPFGISGYYTVITMGEALSPAQIAIDTNGHSYRRKKTSLGWQDWMDEAIDYSNILLAGDSPQYTDFNDFPIGSIVVVSDLQLNNSPEAYGNTGHDSMDTGNVIANVITYSTTPYNPYLITQIAAQYRSTIHGTPKISFRTAIRINGSYTWSKWNNLNQDGVIHSTNRIVDINHLDYTFDDFDDAPKNSIYQVDYNVANSVANNPAPGKSGSLMTYGFSDSSRHAQTQIYITHESTDACMYFRYGFDASPGVYSWTPWSKVKTEILS